MSIHRIPVSTTGAAGSATGSKRSALLVYGRITAIRVDYAASAPATTTVTVKELGAMGRTLLDVPAGNTDGVFYPSAQLQGITGTGIGEYVPFVVAGEALEVTVGASNQLTDAVIVTVQTEVC